MVTGSDNLDINQSSRGSPLANLDRNWFQKGHWTQFGSVRYKSWNWRASGDNSENYWSSPSGLSRMWSSEPVAAVMGASLKDAAPLMEARAGKWKYSGSLATSLGGWFWITPPSTLSCFMSQTLWIWLYFNCILKHLDWYTTLSTKMLIYANAQSVKALNTGGQIRPSKDEEVNRTPEWFSLPSFFPSSKSQWLEIQ